MKTINIEDAARAMGAVGRLRRVTSYHDMLVYTLEFDGIALKVQGYVTDRTHLSIPIDDLFKIRRNLHPLLRMYQEFSAIRCMEKDGMTVRLDDLSSHRFRVRVQCKEGRAFIYNEHTTSSSGYPILSAFEKFQAWKDGRR